MSGAICCQTKPVAGPGAVCCKPLAGPLVLALRPLSFLPFLRVTLLRRWLWLRRLLRSCWLPLAELSLLGLIRSLRSRRQTLPLRDASLYWRHLRSLLPFLSATLCQWPLRQLGSLWRLGSLPRPVRSSCLRRVWPR